MTHSLEKTLNNYMESTKAALWDQIQSQVTTEFFNTTMNRIFWDMLWNPLVHNFHWMCCEDLLRKTHD